MKNYNKFISEQEKINKNNSSSTSRKQVAAAFKKIDWTGIKLNFDYGGGKFDEATSWLKKHHDVTNLVYDPYNRDSEHNMRVWINADDAETTTLFNVLCVIPTKEERKKILKDLKRKNTQKIYISVYEKTKSGKGEKTKYGWQNNMPLEDYFPEIQEIYPSAYINKRMIVINI